MKALTTYLTFPGNCRQAMTFYAQCLKAELSLSPMSEAPGTPPETARLIMHACLTKGTAQLMASDTMHGQPIAAGFNFSIAITCESLEEIESLFVSLSEGGQITMPLADMFWNARFGMLTDQFGIQWMLNFEKSKS